MGLMDKLSKVGIKSVELEESKIYKDRDVTVTGVASINIALSGEIDGGFGSGVGILAGPSKHFKSNTGLVLVKSYLEKYKDAICIFYDNEFGAPPDYWKAQGIDTSRVLHVPIANIEDLKFDLPQKLEQIEKGDKVFIFVDSIGNLASKKEAQDAIDGKATTDMTRAREMKSMFRIITPMVKLRNIPAVFVAHTYQTMEMFSKAVVSGGTGPYYSADWIIIFGRQQEKDGTDLIGFNFILNVEKSRFVKERSKIPMNVLFEGGINKYSGMMDLALESGDLIKPKNGWYQIVDTETGEVSEKSYRESDLYCDEVLGIIVKRSKFKEFVKNKYKLTGNAISDSAADDFADSVLNGEDDDIPIEH
jgi:RecA/RadA recombinase